MALQFLPPQVQVLKNWYLMGQAERQSLGQQGLRLNHNNYFGHANTGANISGLHSSGLTVNAIHDTASPSTYVFSAGGALTVNLDVDLLKQHSLIMTYF